MQRKPPYTPTKFAILYTPPDYSPVVAEGEYVIHNHRKAFFVTGVSPSKRIPGKVNLKVLRWPLDEVSAGAVVHHTVPHRKPRSLKNRLKLTPSFA
jgi:hypothetical protein